MYDIRQTDQWGDYLKSINWQVEKLAGIQVYINKIPFLNRSVIKIQHPKNPLPFTKIDTIAKKYRALCVVIEPDCTGFKFQEFQKAGFKRSNMFLTHTLTTHINLNQSEKKLWSSFSENARRNIRKSQQNNLKVAHFFPKDKGFNDAFETFYQLLQDLIRMKSIWAPPFKELLQKVKSFQNNQFLLLASNNQPVAAVWVLYTKNTATYMHTGVSQKGYDLLANYLLVWEAFKIAKKLKLKIFDFEGLYDPRFPNQKKSWKNFSEFKKRFHGNLVEYPQPMIKCYNIFFKFIFLCNKIFSKP